MEIIANNILWPALIEFNNADKWLDYSNNQSGDIVPEVVKKR